MIINVMVLLLSLAVLAILLPVGSMWASFKLLIDRASRPKLGQHVADCPAILITASTDCCSSARMMEGKRYPSSEAPGLPLSDCTREHCSCTYTYSVKEPAFRASR